MLFTDNRSTFFTRLRTELLSVLLLAVLTVSLLPDAAAGAHAAAGDTWKYENEHWYRLAEDGTYRTGWQLVNGKWYYMDGEGVMATGWQLIGGKWYYLEQSGAMRTGWVLTGGKWYYMDKSGAMVRGWLQQGSKWYFLDGNGAMVTGWRLVREKWYYFTADGSMWTGWGLIGGKWYYFRPDGDMVTGWNRIGQKWYFFTGVGYMVTGTQNLGGKTYIFDENGAWLPGAGKIVVLDPGHSKVVAEGKVRLGPGSDEYKDADTLGTHGEATGVFEYELNLTMGFKIKKELESRGYTVYMTRTDHNEAHDCIERAKVANDLGADIFVRLHANGSSDRSRVGAMTICITKDNPFVPEMYAKSKLLSVKLLDAYVKATGCYREYVWETDTMTGNNWSEVPTTLIEFGYMTNKDEDRKMQNASYQTKMTQGVANGIDDYFEAVN